MTIPYRLTRGAIDVAEGVAGLVLMRLRQNDSAPSARSGAAEPTAWRPPAPNTMDEPPTRPAPRSPAARRPAGSTNGRSTTATPRRARSAPAAPPTPPAPAPAPPAQEPAPAAGAPEPPVAPAISEPTHTSTEVELVEEFSDPGAEAGAGAQIRIGEPWEGYRQMKAADIVDRLASASREEIAAVELFETAGRKRKSILSAAERALKQATPPR